MKYKSRYKLLIGGLAVFLAVGVSTILAACTPKGDDLTSTSKHKDDPNKSLLKPNNPKDDSKKPSGQQQNNKINPNKNPNDDLSKKDLINKDVNKDINKAITNKPKDDSLKQNQEDSSKKTEKLEMQKQSDSSPTKKQPEKDQKDLASKTNKPQTNNSSSSIDQKIDPPKTMDPKQNQNSVNTHKDKPNPKPNLQNQNIEMINHQSKEQKPPVVGSQQNNKNQDSQKQDNVPSSQAENIDKTKPLLKFKDEKPYLTLYPGSNDARLSFVLDKQQYNGDLKNKIMIVMIQKLQGGTPFPSVPIKLNGNNENIELQFRPIIESTQYKLVSGTIFSETNKINTMPNDAINLILSKDDIDKKIFVKKEQVKKGREVPEEEKSKLPVVIKFTDNNDNLELNVETKDKKPVTNKYLKFILTGLDKASKEYVSPDYNFAQDLLITDGKVTIPWIKINGEYKNKYDEIVLKIIGIYDNQNDQHKSSEYRFEYEDSNTIIDRSNNLILIKKIGE